MEEVLHSFAAPFLFLVSVELQQGSTVHFIKAVDL